ncbi:type 2 lantibiotic, SP_1948 family [Pilibacter termitis]|uniref:Type 2 lantibiotic, SP_1948 family n=1 Tax=Pilibacter termitis TaxID=263852 RepID=A0A1T4KFW2_9ENTE|nr:lichenicidin A2 family type 2 lantibiotic [Pilibacter termitis]SJZ41266.1 type 2 lantibiotic, SP_1948 family [Pilibacter termitis]
MTNKKEVEKTEEPKETKVVGAAFEDMSLSEMNEVQGAGDVNTETTTVCAVFATACGAIQVVRTIKKKC